MSGVTRAMWWEYWRLPRAEAGFNVLVASGMALLFYTTMVPAQAPAMAATGTILPFVSGLIFVTLFFSSITSSFWLRIDSGQLGFPFSQGFTRPVSTRKLVVVPLLFASASGVATYVIPATVWRYVFDVPLPLLGPAVAVACVVSCFSCAVWSTWSRRSRIFALMLSGSGFVAAAILFCRLRQSDAPIILALGRPEFFELSIAEFAVAIFLVLVAFAVCLKSVKRQRQGDKYPFDWRGDSDCKATASVDSVQTDGATKPLSQLAASPPTTLVRAQLWRCWRQAGPPVLLVAALLPIILAVFLSVAQILKPGWPAAPYFWAVAILAAPVLYQLIAVECLHGLRRKNAVSSLSLFDAVQPIRSDKSIVIRLWVVVVLALAGWAILLSVAWLQTVWSGQIAFWQDVAVQIQTVRHQLDWGEQLLLLSSLFTAFVVSGCMALGITLSLTLIPQKYYNLPLAVISVAIGVIVLDLETNWSFTLFWKSVQVVGMFMVLAFAVGCVRQSKQRSVCRPSYIAVAVWMSVVLAAAAIQLLPFVEKLVPTFGWQHYIGTTAMIFCEVIIAVLLPPLALNMHRHG